MIVTKFSRFLILDAATNKIISPPENFVFDYADDAENIIGFRGIESVNLELFNSYENKKYILNVPTSYRTVRRKIKIERI